MALRGIILLLVCELVILAAGSPPPITRAGVDRRVGTASDGTGREVFAPWRPKEVDAKVHPYLYDYHRQYIVLNATTDAGSLDQASRKLLQDKEEAPAIPVSDPIVKGAVRHPPGSGRSNEAAEVRVYAVAIGEPSGETDPGANLEAELIALGARDVSRAGLSVSCFVPLVTVPLLSGLSNLESIRPSLAMTNAVAVAEGGKAMRTDVVRSLYGFNGAGIRVGVLSDSFDMAPKDPSEPDAAADFLNGELPLDTMVLQDSATTQTDEGRAMMQLIYDAAPGVSLAFHTAFVGEVGMANAIKKLAQVAGCKVICDDVSYLSEPFFMDGPIAQAVTFVHSLGVAYFSSAGNLARLSYSAPYRPSGSFKEHGELHDYDPGDGVATSMYMQFPSGGCLVLQWDDPWKSVTQRGGAATDLDIYAYNFYTGALVAQGVSVNVNNDPFEYLCLPTSSSVNYATGGRYNITIEHYAGPRPTVIKWVGYNYQIKVMEWATDSSTCTGHANSAGGVGVGAALYSKTPPFGKTPAEMEAFSSVGNTPILFATDGTRLATPINRQQPRFAAPDGCVTSFFGSGLPWPRFYGTSAASPHAAAAAAVVWQVNPRLTVDELYNTLASTASPIYQPVYNEVSGYGLIDVKAAVDLLTTECPAATDAECNDNQFCNGLETCNTAIKLCQMGPLPCSGSSFCDENLDRCVQCLENRNCDNGLFCDGAETCVNGTCVVGTAPCSPSDCQENTDTCASVVRFEVGTVVVGATHVTVNLRKRYTNPVVVTSLFQKNNFQPTVVRVRNATSSSFQLHLTAPGGTAAVVNDTVHYIVMEAGRWQVGSLKMEAVRYETAFADYKNVFVGDKRTLLWSDYTDILVLGQVMTENNIRFVQFFSRGSTAILPPTPTDVWTGMHVGEDPDRVRVTEMLGYIIAQKQDAHMFFNGAEAEIFKTGPVVAGVSNSILGATITYKVAFPAAPAACVATMMGMAGLDGGWSVQWGYNTAGITNRTMVLISDEDLLFDTERTHKVEVVGYMCFSSTVAYPACTEDSQCSDGVFCNGAERCGSNGDCVPALNATPCGSSQCSEAMRKCFECSADSDCSGRSDGRNYCNTVTNTCVACTSSSHCSDGLFCNGIEVCDAGQCKAGAVQCAGTSHPVCDEQRDVCVQCMATADCAGTGRPLCDLTARVCVDCVTVADCPSQGLCAGTQSCSAGTCVSSGNPCEGTALPYCNPSTGACHQCSEDSHCAGRADGKLRCHPTLFECRQCVDNAGCSNGLFCDGQEICTSSGTCTSGTPPCGGSTPACDEASDTCVGCLKNSDCSSPSAPFCGAQRTCVACTLDAHCPDLDGILCNNIAQCSPAGVCLQNVAPPCSSGVVCDYAANRCVQPCAADADCNPTGAVCANYRRCKVSTGLCYSSSEDPCFRDGMLCDVAADVCRAPTCALDMDCDDGSFCTGQEACKDGVCYPGTNPCPGQVCDEGLDKCTPYMEAGVVNVAGGADGTVVALQNTYRVPVIVVTLINQNNRGAPVLVRMRDVTTNSFRLTLRSVRATGPTPVADTVHFLVVEEGTWTVGGAKLEAYRVQTSRFDSTLLGWDGTSLPYRQSYRSPVVLASVMTSNNAGQWSAPWMKGLFGGAPSVSSPLVLGAHVSAASTCTGCVPETLGYIIMETTARAHGQINLVEYEAARGPVTIMGMGDRAGEFQYLLRASFRNGPPGVLLANVATQNGPRGGWLHVLSTADPTYFTAAVDEEGRAGDGVRTHPREAVNYMICN
eukprot:jgi/Mesvir1/18198/Mv09482-RA.1